MVDSTAYERGPDSPSYSAVSGDRIGAERTRRSTAPDDLEAPGTEHASALLRMGALTLEAGGYSDAEDLFRRALEIGERALGPDDPALVPAMTSLASARIMSGKFDDAEPLVARALAISENGPAEHDPELAIVLNDLARLCLKQSAHALAEPLLLRMLALKRSKGEDHPEVATVLASLATVRQALGRHESAEQLWRRVLDIRERTLAPNHFGLATALEHLGEACAARGKIDEALQLFKRAQTIRELTLGAGHASLRISRDRIADLQLQAEGFLDAAASEVPVPPPERYRLLLADNQVVGFPPPVRERSAAPPRKGTARVVEREPTTNKAEIAPLPLSPHVAPPPPVVGFAEAAARPEEPTPVTYRDVLMSIQQELENDNEPVVTSNRVAEIFASGVAALKQRQTAAMISVTAIALVVVLATVSSAWSESGASTTAGGASLLAGTLSTPAPSAEDVSGRPAVLANDSEKPPATSAAAATPVATSDRVRVVEQRSPAKRTPDRRADPIGISIPTMSSALATDFDSVVRARGGSAREAGESLAVPPLPETGSGQRLTFESDDAGSAPQSAQLIGSLPTPRYPSQLRDVQGDVRVRFDVDRLGRPVMSSLSVVNSPNTMMTAAVLKVIPGLRFVPARSGGVDSKAIADVVQLRFQFRPNNN